MERNPERDRPLPSRRQAVLVLALTAELLVTYAGLLRPERQHVLELLRAEQSSLEEALRERNGALAKVEQEFKARKRDVRARLAATGLEGEELDSAVEGFVAWTQKKQKAGQ